MTPTAAKITVRETLQLLDVQFAGMAKGVAQGRYALWLGSGISRGRVDDLSRLNVRLFTFLQGRINHAATACRFKRALEDVLDQAQLSPTDKAAIDRTKPVMEWHGIDTILLRLSTNYSRMLDVSVDGEPSDFLLWDAVNVCDA
jgi:hypothetical protein